MKEIYLHIGLHKTGSTYIQKTFAKNRFSLKEANIEYPEIGAEFLFGHHNFAWSFIPNKSFKNVDEFTSQGFVEKIQKTNLEKIVISSEDFSFLKAEHIEKVFSTLKNFKVLIVLYVRHPCLAFYSLWQERIKHGDTISISDFYEKLLNSPCQLDYVEIARSWSSIFGKESVKTIIYDNLVESNEDLSLFFLEKIVKIRPSTNYKSEPDKKVNQSSSIAITEVIRYFNSLSKKSRIDKSLSFNFIKFLTSDKKGMIVAKELSLMEKNSCNLISLHQLNNIFIEKEKEFIDGKFSAINPYSSNRLFRPLKEKNMKIPLIELSSIEKVIDIEKIYFQLAHA